MLIFRLMRDFEAIFGSIKALEKGDAGHPMPKHRPPKVTLSDLKRDQTGSPFRFVKLSGA